MNSRHIAFCVEQAYGHILPTLGMAGELVSRGHRVSYAVSPSFVSTIDRFGARAAVINPLASVTSRMALCKYAAQPDGSYDFSSNNAALDGLSLELYNRRTEDSLAQLERAYERERPDLIVHDYEDQSADFLASKWAIPRVGHYPHILSREDMSLDPDGRLILVSVPKFFNPGADEFDERFKFVGFSPEGRREFFSPWVSNKDTANVILICPTTGLPPQPQTELVRLMVDTFRDQPWTVVLSMSNQLDPFCAMNSECLANLPPNIVINRSSSNLEILEHACLFIGQGGQGSTLEALYCGVPTILISATDFHDTVARRVVELGLGTRLHISDLTANGLIEAVRRLIGDDNVAERVRKAKLSMHSDRAAELSADLIEEHLSAHANV